MPAIAPDDGHDREDLPARAHARVPRGARRVGDDPDLEPEPHSRVEHPQRERGQDPEEESERDDHRRAEGRPVRGLGHGLPLREGARLKRRRVAPVRRAVEDQVREQKASDVVEHQRRDDLVRPREGAQDAGDQRPERPERCCRNAHGDDEERRRRGVSVAESGARSTTPRPRRGTAAPRRRC